MATVRPNEVFLSHSSLDRGFASDLATVVRRHGVPVWYSQTNILGAQQWQDEIGAALQRCDWFLVILSPQSADSMWVKRELTYALNQNRFEDRIVPIVYQQSDYQRLSWALSLIQMVDFTQTLAQGYIDLLRIWGLGYTP
jgi:TIR domain